jgi:predicted ArsR family transcriptional regulator
VKDAAFDATVGEISALDQPLRRDLFAVLDRVRWTTRDEAAETLGVPRTVAAFHLDKLADAGFAEVRFARPSGKSGPGAGRPSKQYRRSDRELAVSIPQRHYDLAGRLLADAVAESSASGRSVAEALRDAAHALGAQIGTEVGRDVPRRRSAKAVRDAAMKALKRLGYEPREDGRDIALMNCPFHALAERQRPLVCGMNLDLLDGLTEALDPRIKARQQHEEGMCCVRLKI